MAATHRLASPDEMAKSQKRDAENAKHRRTGRSVKCFGTRTDELTWGRTHSGRSKSKLNIRRFSLIRDRGENAPAKSFGKGGAGIAHRAPLLPLRGRHSNRKTLSSGLEERFSAGCRDSVGSVAMQSPLDKREFESIELDKTLQSRKSRRLSARRFSSLLVASRLTRAPSTQRQKNAMTSVFFFSASCGSRAARLASINYVYL